MSPRRGGAWPDCLGTLIILAAAVSAVLALISLVISRYT
jgi:hypothetical protein